MNIQQVIHEGVIVKHDYDKCDFVSGNINNLFMHMTSMHVTKATLKKQLHGSSALKIFS